MPTADAITLSQHVAPCFSSCRRCLLASPALQSEKALEKPDRFFLMAVVTGEATTPRGVLSAPRAKEWRTSHNGTNSGILVERRRHSPGNTVAMAGGRELVPPPSQGRSYPLPPHGVRGGSSPAVVTIVG
ncbi:hypothetical protein BS78_03G173100 [Paspalum vaginatum]|nr:hypothetical protein BS78_03G173100 [Paspalum vaginatum]